MFRPIVDFGNSLIISDQSALLDGKEAEEEDKDANSSHRTSGSFAMSVLALGMASAWALL